MPLRIVLVDDHALVRDGIRSLLEGEADFRVVGEADDGASGLARIRELRPDLAILDIRMPRTTGIETVAALRAAGNPVPCLMLSMHDSEEYVLQSIRAGANGYLMKDASREEFLKAIHTITGGERYFSGDLSHILVKHIVAAGGSGAEGAAPAKPPASNPPPVKLPRRQHEILQLIVRGHTNQEIADELGLSRRTVETHRYKMMERLEVNNKGDLVRRARELGLVKE